MHASQTPWPDGSEPGEPTWADKSKLPKKHLLAKAGSSACVGCHSSATSSTYYDLDGCNVPVVFYKGGSAPTSYLAGGNFWWVKEGMSGADDTKGHNVFLNETDDNLDEAPGDMGFASCGTNGCHSNLHLAASGTGFDELNGKYGCEGCHLNVKHHAHDHLNGVSGCLLYTSDAADE